ncbi:MAG: RHS repeat-associated core domain-containing protein [Allosphingosinicella sp.]
MIATFGYDDQGRRTSLTRGTGVVTSYGYDPVSRLASLALDFSGTSNDLTLGLDYSPASQIVSNSRSNDLYSWTGHRSGTTSTSADGLNRIPDWVTTLGYDPKGNIASDGNLTYAYSSENLLTSILNPVSTQQTSAALEYDGLMRLSKIDSSNAVLDTELGYDGEKIAYESLTSSRTRRYVFGPGIDEPLVAYLITSTGTSRTWYQADEHGSIVGLTPDSGTPFSGVGTFDEYGVGTGASKFHYAGLFWLGDANLHYARARIYDARLGRFLQPDPIGYEGGMNLYAYVRGDPVNFRDPRGLECGVNIYTWHIWSHGQDLGSDPKSGPWGVTPGCGGPGGGILGFGSGIPRFARMPSDGGGAGESEPQEPPSRSMSDAEKKLFMCHGFDPAFLDRITIHNEMTSTVASFVYMGSNAGAVTIYHDIYYRRGAPSVNAILHPGAGGEPLRTFAEEVGHALQYAQGMTLTSYVRDFFQNGGSYGKSTYEQIAKDFADSVVRDFRSGVCTGDNPLPPAMR